MTRHQHLKAFEECVLRFRLIKKDLLSINSNIDAPKYREKRDYAETAYLQTLDEIISRGKKYLSLNPETDNAIRVAIDLDKYENILKKF